MNDHPQPIVHLVGSIPLDNTENVFRTVCSLVPEHLPRLPDGETGERIGWIKFIQQMLARHPDLEVDQSRPPFPFRQWDGVVVREIPQVKFKDGTDLSAVKFETGYADAAIDSFAVFERLQSEGVIPAETKFQISIPTPMAPTYNYVSPPARDEFLSVYEPQLMGEVEKIAAALPHDRLAIQWDVCQEVLVYEDYYLELPGTSG